MYCTVSTHPHSCRHNNTLLSPQECSYVLLPLPHLPLSISEHLFRLILWYNTAACRVWVVGVAGFHSHAAAATWLCGVLVDLIANEVHLLPTPASLKSVIVCVRFSSAYGLPVDPTPVTQTQTRSHRCFSHYSWINNYRVGLKHNANNRVSTDFQSQSVIDSSLVDNCYSDNTINCFNCTKFKI